MDDNLAYQDELWEEMIDGEMVMMSPASINHNRVAGNIFSMLNSYLKGRVCEAFSDGAAVYLTDKDYYIPDVAVVCDPDKVRPDGIHGAPDLVVEVLSPATARYDRGRKKDIYERGGVREYWIVDPSNKTVEQYLLTDGRFLLRDIYAILPAWTDRWLPPEKRGAPPPEFQCSLCDDLTISLAEIFDRVP